MVRMKNVARGVALGTLLGSIAVALYPKRFEIMEALRDQTHCAEDKAREYSNLLSNGQHTEEPLNHYLTGGLAGLLLGAGMALFLTPKSGKQLRAQVVKAYNAFSDKPAQRINEMLKTHQGATESEPAPSPAKPKKRTAKR
ncbi:hypothetical protein PHSC3_000121 [Chlamydiales bacterium STE3]|nr:hypothetical protein PHSC3_000121 [Chlamydiales bacterium STE3]